MRAIVTVQGFTESLSARSGTENLYYEVVREFAGPLVTTFHPLEWNRDMKSFVDMLARQRIYEVVLIGYSWGAGFGCMKFARHAYERGISIPLALLCDPVYRPTWMPAWMGANPLLVRSLLSSPKITVPRAIKRVEWVRQKLTIPAGHDLATESPSTRISPPKTLAYGHTGIDESPEWFSLVRNELEFLLKPAA